jgi:hypothetical protein
MTVIKRFGIDFNSKGGALTLSCDEVSDLEFNDENCGLVTHQGVHKKTHPSGWTISGKVSVDYFSWVNEFSATHPTLGEVKGDFEDMVEASSEEAFQHFYSNHPPEDWDYADI